MISIVLEMTTKNRSRRAQPAGVGEGWPHLSERWSSGPKRTWIWRIVSGEDLPARRS